MLKLMLSLLVLVAFSWYPSADGISREKDESLEAFYKTIERREAAGECFSGSQMTNTVKSCMAGVTKAPRDYTTEEECRSAVKRLRNCYANGFNDCGLNPRLQGLFTFFVSRELATKDCLPKDDNYVATIIL